MGAGAGQRCAAAAVVVHGMAEAVAALAAVAPGREPKRRGVLLLSAPGAAGTLGAAWFLRCVERAAVACPGVPHWAAFDCGDAPGHALAALRAGARRLILDPGCPAFAAVAAAAVEADAELWTTRPPALDLATLDLRHGGARRLAEWLAAEPGAGGIAAVTAA